MDRKTNNLATEIAEEIREMQDMKSTQPVGADSYNVFESVSSVYSYAVPAFGYNYKVSIKFTADKQENAFALLSYKLYVNSPPPAPENKEFMFDVIKRNSPVDSLETIWDIYLYDFSGSPVTYYMQFFVQSFDTGVVQNV